MEHKNEIAIKLLRHEYADYDNNSWHYDREYKMIVEAQNLALAKESDARASDDKCHIQNVIASGKAERIKHFMIGVAASLTCAEHHQRVEIAETLFEKLKETDALSDSFHLL